MGYKFICKIESLLFIPHFDPSRITLVWQVASIRAASSIVENSTKACCLWDRNRICLTKPKGMETARMSNSVVSSGRLRICSTFDGKHAVIF